MTSMAREAVTTSYITTKLRRIPNGLLGSNERTSLSHERLPSFPLYIYIFSDYFAGCIPLPSSAGQENGKSLEIGSPWARMAVFHPSCDRLSTVEEYFFMRATISRSPSHPRDPILLNEISLLRRSRKKRILLGRERERERMESEIFCRSILNEQTNEKRSGRSEKQWEERKVGGKNAEQWRKQRIKKERNDIAGRRDTPGFLSPSLIQLHFCEPSCSSVLLGRMGWGVGRAGLFSPRVAYLARSMQLHGAL